MGLYLNRFIGLECRYEQYEARMYTDTADDHSDGTVKDVPLLCRIDTLDEVTYMNNGGILQTVLRDLAA